MEEEEKIDILSTTERERLNRAIQKPLDPLLPLLKTQQKKIMMTIWLPRELKQRLEIYCIENDVAMSQLVRRLLHNYLVKHEY